MSIELGLSFLPCLVQRFCMTCITIVSQTSLSVSVHSTHFAKEREILVHEISGPLCSKSRELGIPQILHPPPPPPSCFEKKDVWATSWHCP